MKKPKIGLLIFFFSIFSIGLLYGQNSSYGIILGINAYHIEEVKGEISGAEGLGVPNFGVYYEFPINSALNLRTSLLYNPSSEDNGYDVNNSNSSSRILERVKTKNLILSPTLKYSLSQKSKNSLYALAGFQISFLLNATAKDNPVLIDNFFNDSTFAVLGGIGVSLSKAIGLELYGDYGLSNRLKLSSSKLRAYGVHLNFIIDLEAIRN